MILGNHLNHLHEASSVWPSGLTMPLVRIATLHWNQIETSPGVFDWTKADATFGKIPATTKVILSTSGTPVFYSARPTEPGLSSTLPIGTRAEPTDYTKFKTFIKTIVARYQSKLFAVEGPNEPEAGASFTGTVEACVEMQRQLWVGILEMSLGGIVKVISPPVVLGDKGHEWLPKIQNTAGMDFIGAHYYDETLDPTDLITHLRRVKDTMRRFGGANVNKPIWITEFGFNPPTKGLIRFPDMPVVMQKSMLRNFVKALASEVQGAMYFAYDDVDFSFKGNVELEAEWNAIQQWRECKA